MKIPLVIKILVFLIILVPSYTTSTNASIKPIITTIMPHELVIGLQDTNLTWFVIDDNLKSYSIFSNDSLWRMENFSDSNVIQVRFSNVAGFYNLTLTVQDYSGFSTNATQYVKVIESSPTSTNQQATSSSKINSANQASPGFEFYSVLLILAFSSFFSSKIRKKH